MSCGGAHATPCSEVLSMVFFYIDGEIDEQHEVQVTTHLQECPPCEGEYAIERRVRSLVQRCCRGDGAPESVRERIITEIRQISITRITGQQ
jgi:mycothiol system anti-sigma-R factor